ncbi:MAG TPA: hypothetical protein VE974_28635 [Thermoanaerobaculia bacterium]|nr:hypothetical protein [Thermoanaerobaculia bacterium]
MEDVRNYRIEEDEQFRTEDDRVECNASSQDDEVPFHIPRD